MSTSELLRPILDGGIRSANFFNGRLLSAEDLSREQSASREARRHLGRAIGEGVAYGFEVSKAPQAGLSAIVTVQPGLAINRNGDVLKLPTAVDLSLVRPQGTAVAAADAAAFDTCTPLQAGAYVTGSGVYLLTVSPAQGREGRAPVSGLQNAAAECNTKYLVEGVQFRLIQLDFTPDELNDALRLRNRVAFYCFGIAETQAALADPFGPPLETYGLLDGLRPNRLTDCEMPLAVLFWTATGGIRFIDLWSVRRKVTDVHISPDWPGLISRRRLSEAEAMLLQFEDQIEDLRVDESNLGSVVAARRFGFLPAAGLLPMASPNAPLGFNPIVFFGERGSSEVAMLDADSLRGLLQESLYHEPIGAARERIQLYAIWENVLAVEAGESVQPVLVFAKHTLGYRGVSRFGRAAWALGRFANMVL
jgi:hypothetical protein